MLCVMTPTEVTVAPTHNRWWSCSCRCLNLDTLLHHKTVTASSAGISHVGCCKSPLIAIIFQDNMRFPDFWRGGGLSLLQSRGVL